MDALFDHPFTWGLLAGLAVAFYVWVRGIARTRAVRVELAKLEDMLHTKLRVEARSHKLLHDELEALRQQNENLRVTNKTLQQKPDRNELRMLHIYDQAVRTLLSRSPGFGPAWQNVLDEAERDMEESERGLSGFVRRVFAPRPSIKVLPREPVDTEGESSDDR